MVLAVADLRRRCRRGSFFRFFFLPAAAAVAKLTTMEFVIDEVEINGK